MGIIGAFAKKNKKGSQDNGVSCKPLLLAPGPPNSTGLARALGCGFQFPFCNPNYKNKSKAAHRRSSPAG
jgi:hypothetical protein